MTGRIILWLCVIWVPAVLYAFLANETKFKKNIAVGVTLPFEARSHPEVLARLRRFKIQLRAVCLALTALALAGLLAPLSMGESLTAMLVWTDLAILAPAVVYARCNRALLAIKEGQGWQGAPSATVTVDLSAASQPMREVTAGQLLPPLAVSLLPVGWEALGRRWDTALLLLVGPACVLLVWLVFRFAFRRKSELVDANTARTQALTRLRRQNWRRQCTAACWAIALMGVLMGLSLYHPLPALGLLALVIAALAGFVFRMELSLRRAQEKLTADSGQGCYVDEDSRWIWGMFYHNPDDRRLVVNNRVGSNTTVNLARPAGKVLAGLLGVLLLLLPLLGVWIMGEERTPVELALTDTTLVASHGGSRYEIPLEDIQEAVLLDRLPDGLTRVAGTAMDTVSKGRYRCDQWGSLELCIDPRQGPWLLVTTWEGAVYLFGAPGVTAAVAEGLT